MAYHFLYIGMVSNNEYFHVCIYWRIFEMYTSTDMKQNTPNMENDKH